MRKKWVRLTGNEQVDIVNRYQHLERMEDLAKEYKVTRQAVWKVLQRFGVDTQKGHTQLEVSCSVCGSIFLRHRYRVRGQLHHFCSTECYHAFLDAGNGKPYIQSRWGQYMARQKVSEFFPLRDKQIVHHEDRNTLNNDLDNLRVFACNGDHVRYHRGFDVQPIWDGRKPTDF